MATVRMRIQITGARDLEPWPAPGELIEVPDHEAADLIAAGYAEDVPDATQPAEHSDSDTAGDDDGEATQAGAEATTDDEATADDSDSDTAGDENADGNRSVMDEVAARDIVDVAEVLSDRGVDPSPKPGGRRPRKS